MAKIMIVDDSDTIRAQVVSVLQAAGHELIEAIDGVDGLAKIDANAGVQLIICDVNMPQMDGLTMCSKVHQNPTYKNIPIFMLTTESGPEMKAKGKDAGVLAWIVKPFQADKLLTAVVKVLERKAAA